MPITVKMGVKNAIAALQELERMGIEDVKFRYRASEDPGHNDAAFTWVMSREQTVVMMMALGPPPDLGKRGGGS